MASAIRIINKCHYYSVQVIPVERGTLMRRSRAVLLSMVLTVAAMGGLHSTAAVAAPEPGTVVDTWFTGTMEPGATKSHRSWLNVRPDYTYDVSLSPVGASTEESCDFRVDRLWNKQRPEGNRDLRYIIRNSGRVACAATVMVYRIPAKKVRSTGGIDPGATKTFAEQGLDPTKIYRVGLLASGATASHECELEVVRLWFYRHFLAEGGTGLRVSYEVKNVGAIACQGDVLLGSAPIEHSSSIGEIRPGKWSGHGMDASPNTAYVPGMVPNVGCNLELWVHDLQWVNHRNGSTEREVFLSAHNLSATACDGRFVLASI